MRLFARCLWCLRIALVASVIVLGAVIIPVSAQANEGVTEAPIETSETAIPLPEPIETDPQLSPPEELPVADLPLQPARADPAPTKPVIPAPARPAPVITVPASPAPVQPAPGNGTDQDGLNTPVEEPAGLEAENPEETPTAEPSSASPSASAKPSSSTSPTAVPSTTQTEEPEVVVSSSRFPGGPTAAQWLMIALLLALGVLYLRFMRRGVKHVSSAEVQPAPETGK